MLNAICIVNWLVISNSLIGQVTHGRWGITASENPRKVPIVAQLQNIQLTVLLAMQDNNYVISIEIAALIFNWWIMWPTTLSQQRGWIKLATYLLCKSGVASLVTYYSPWGMYLFSCMNKFVWKVCSINCFNRYLPGNVLSQGAMEKRAS